VSQVEERGEKGGRGKDRRHRLLLSLLSIHLDTEYEKGEGGGGGKKEGKGQYWRNNHLTVSPL